MNPWYIAFLSASLVGAIGIGLTIPGIAWAIKDKWCGMLWWGIGSALGGTSALVLAVHLSPYRDSFWAS